MTPKSRSIPSPKKGAPASEPIRLSKALSMARVASRRKAEELILQGAVSVNGETVLELGTKIDPAKDKIHVEGKPVRLDLNPIYLLLNKPRGCLTTLKDDRGRRTVMDLIHGISTPVFPVGRLDYNSEGLLILTNDGDFAQRLSHPKFRIPRTYHVKARGYLDPKRLEKMKQGTRIEDKRLEVDEIRVLESAGKVNKLEFVLHQGLNREVRVLCERMGLLVVKLKRVRVGNLSLGALKPGEYRQLRKEELHRLLKPVPKGLPPKGTKPSGPAKVEKRLKS